MNSSTSIKELEAFSASPRRRDKPTLPLKNVLILSTSPSPKPVDLFDALFKGPFSATGTYTTCTESKLKCIQPTPCLIQFSNIYKFGVEEDNQTNPPSVKIYFEGSLAWYEIVSAHPSYASIFTGMQLKAQLWLWIQLRRSVIMIKSKTRTSWPSLKQLYRDLPSHLESRGVDLIDTFHPYVIERIIQSHFSGETLAVGPEGMNPQWMECLAVTDLQNKYPAVWRSIYDRVEATLNQGHISRAKHQEPLSPISMPAEVQKASKETRRLQELFYLNAEEIKLHSSNLSSAANIILQSLDLSDPWQNLTDLELIEKFENHAESLLSDCAFTESFKDCTCLNEIRDFCTDKNWWKRRRLTQNRVPHRRRGRRPKSHEDSSEPTTLETSRIDLSQDTMPMETPGPRYPKTAKKGTSILRPTFSASHTPGTPTPQIEDESNDLVESDRDTTDDELELLQLPADVSLGMKNEKNTTRKRKVDFTVENVCKKPRTQIPQSFQFGCGRPPLTTVPIPSSSNERTTIFRCQYPECNYSRLSSASTSVKAEIDKHHRLHRNEIRDALDMLKDPYIIGGRVGGEKGNRLVRPIGGIDHLIERIEGMAKGLGNTPSKQLVV